MRICVIFMQCVFIEQRRPLKNGRLGLCTVVWLLAKVRERGHGLRPWLNDDPVCDAQRR